jgi:TorA maturation chaperone TorD
VILFLDNQTGEAPVTVETPTILPAAIASSSLRGDLYAMLASLLVQPPSADRIRQLATLTAAPEIPAAVAASLIRLKTAAANTDAVSVQQEYADLFIGLGRGKLCPMRPGIARKS